MSETLTVKLRETRGKRAARRLRANAQVPAVIYGLKKESCSIAIPTGEIESAVRHSSRVVELKGDLNESALIKEVQWDTFGNEIKHVDLARIDTSEMIDLTLRVELRGVAPGSKTGGQVKHLVHELQVSCSPLEVPEKIEVNINSLELGDSITTGQIELPPNTKMASDPDEIIVQCFEVVEVEEETDEAQRGAAEPEVIGRKSEDEEGGGE